MAKILTTAVRLNPKRISDELLNLTIAVTVIFNAVVVCSNNNLQPVTAEAPEKSQHIRPTRDCLFDAIQIQTSLVIEIYAYKGRH